MDNFAAVYRILHALEACMDLEKANIDMFSAQKLGVSHTATETTETLSNT